METRCKSCGRELRADAFRCRFCGATCQFEAVQPAPPAPPPQKKPRKPKQAGIAAGAIAVLALAAFLGFGGEKTSAAADPKEARQEIEKVLPEICNAAIAYYQSHKTLPPGTGETPSIDVRAIDGTFGPDPRAWLQRPTWAALQYFPDGVQRWRYAFESAASGFTVIASNGDQSWQMEGVIERGAIRLRTSGPASGRTR
jgi:hypothetical protein